MMERLAAAKSEGKTVETQEQTTCPRTRWQQQEKATQWGRIQRRSASNTETRTRRKWATTSSKNNSSKNKQQQHKLPSNNNKTSTIQLQPWTALWQCHNPMWEVLWCAGSTTQVLQHDLHHNNCTSLLGHCPALAPGWCHLVPKNDMMFALVTDEEESVKFCICSFRTPLQKPKWGGKSRHQARGGQCWLGLLSISVQESLAKHKIDHKNREVIDGSHPDLAKFDALLGQLAMMVMSDLVVGNDGDACADVGNGDFALHKGSQPRQPWSQSKMINEIFTQMHNSSWIHGATCLW